MPKPTLTLAVLILPLMLMAAVFPEAAAAGIFSRNYVAGGELLPDSGELPGLAMTEKARAYKEAAFLKYYGAAGNRYVQYGMIRLVVGEYSYGDKSRRITVELATMETPTAATGIYHFVRGKVVGRGAQQVDVGAEGMVDAGREKRNLYFYRNSVFVKLIYSGPDPVPDLKPMAELIDAKIPKGRDHTPDGFAYMRGLPGVNQNTVELTPGFTFNIDFMPPAVWASAPAGGSPASDLFIITRIQYKDAEKLAKDYHSYLKMFAEYVEDYRIDKRRYVKAVDPNQGRVVFTSYKNAVIIAVRPDGYEKGEALIAEVIRNIDRVNAERGR